VILRHPGTRNDEERKRAEDRRNALRKKLRRRGSLRAVRVSVSPGDPHWGGSNDLMEQFVEPFMLKRGLRPGSGKRTPKENKAIGGDPDSLHLTTKTTGFGRDFPTFAGEDDARALATSVGFEGWQPNSFAHCTFSAGGRVWDAQSSGARGSSTATTFTSGSGRPELPRRSAWLVCPRRCPPAATLRTPASSASGDVTLVTSFRPQWLVCADNP
jgi:hypothetical protein